MDLEDRVPRIKEVKIRVKPDHYLKLAHEELEKSNNITAIQYYLLYVSNLNFTDDMKLTEQINLSKLIMNLGSNAPSSTQDVQDEIIKCYLGVLNMFPENALLLNSFGLFFFSQGEHTVAKTYFQKSANLGYLPAEKNFLHVIWHLIPRWHFRMLNDQKRNRAYEGAIKRAVAAGFDKVYDIGAGCGLLSMMAAKCENVSVVAFEENKVMYDIALKVLKKNNLLDRITLINCNSNLVKEPPSACNLVITEIFDAGLFGENCLQSVKHVLDNFISEEKFKIIPASAKLYVTGIQSERIGMKHYYTGTLAELNIENLCLLESDSEPYDSEFLKNTNVKYVTNTIGFLTVDFRNSEQLGKLLSNDHVFEELELTCTESGVLHAFAVWFDLNLDEEVTISTDPNNSNNKCWEQGIFHVNPPFYVQASNRVQLRPQMIEGQLKFDVRSESTKPTKRFYVSKEIISFLNDTQLTELVIQTANTYTSCDLKIVDFNVFPLFGFLMAKKGATVCHTFKDTNDLNFYNHLLSINKICEKKMLFIDRTTLEEQMLYLEPPNIVFADWIQTDGSWNKAEFSLEAETKLNCDSLPKKIFLKAQLIYSEYLDFCNKVDDNNTLNFQIGEELNELSGCEHPSLDQFEHRKCSTIVSFDVSDLEKIDYHQEGTVTVDGASNGILYWFDLQFGNDESQKFSTLSSTHYDKTCTYLNSPKFVKEGDKIMIHIMRLEGHLKVYCDLLQED